MKTLVVQLTFCVQVQDAYVAPAFIAQELKKIPAKVFVPHEVEDVELTYEESCRGPVVQ